MNLYRAVACPDPQSVSSLVFGHLNSFCQMLFFAGEGFSGFGCGSSAFWYSGGGH